MKKYNCTCGKQLYFENTKCLTCNKVIGYDFDKDTLHALEKVGDNVYINDENFNFKQCKNYLDFQVCNAIIDLEQENDWCVACQLNETIPNLSKEGNIAKWSKLENAKRRLVRTLLRLDLAVVPRSVSLVNGLAFAFLEDEQSNTLDMSHAVMTGHLNGLITINLEEADDAVRENTRMKMGELYRTVLGHLRHEVGHFYFDALVKNSKYLHQFREIFGNEQNNYQQAIQEFYASKPDMIDNQDFISVYAQSHPLEDWAECWAHYLHMTDSLETAYAYSAIANTNSVNVFTNQLNDWTSLTILLNELNRSMGLNDAYPFIYNANIIKKLNFVHQVIDPTFHPIQ